MNRAELSRVVAKKMNMSPDIVEKVIKTTLTTIKRTVKNNQEVNLQSFGTFSSIYHYDDDENEYCRLKGIEQEPWTVGYAPIQWVQSHFQFTKDWEIFDEYDPRWEDPKALAQHDGQMIE